MIFFCIFAIQMYKLEQQISIIIFKLGEQNFHNCILKTLYFNNLTLLIQIIPLHMINISLEYFLHLPINPIIFITYRWKKDNFDSIQCLIKIELILSSTKVFELSCTIWVNLLYDVRNSLWDTVTILNTMCIWKSFVIWIFIDKIIVVYQFILLPDHQLIYFPLHQPL